MWCGWGGSSFELASVRAMAALHALRCLVRIGVQSADMTKFPAWTLTGQALEASGARKPAVP
jgi:hypothetical protein